MINNEITNLHFINNRPVRTVKASVALNAGATLVSSFDYDGDLKSFTFDRVGDNSKFFGYGVCQKLNVKVRDVNEIYEPSTANNMRVRMAIEDAAYQIVGPTFYVSEVWRDEKTNELSITAYDKLYDAAKKTVAELTLPANYDIRGFTDVVVAALGYNGWDMVGGEDNAFNLYYIEGANFDGAENLREALDMIAEATQTIYYLDENDKLIFKRLDRDGSPVYNIDSLAYFNFDTKTNRRLGRIYHTTELGDDVYAETAAAGTTQYVRDNAFWEMREDIGDIVDAALETMGGLCVNQFELNWRGNYLLEIGDKIAIGYRKAATDVFETIVDTVYLLDDTIEYNGGFNQKTKWEFNGSDLETANNPTSLGETLKKTYARVDKVNKQIDIVASDVNSNKEAIAAIQVKTDEITQTITKVEQGYTELEETVVKNTSDIAEIKITTDEIKQSIESVETKVDSVSGQVVKNTEDIAAIKITTESIEQTVGKLEQDFDGVSGDIIANKNDIASIKLSTQGIEQSVQQLESKVNEHDSSITTNTNNIANITITTNGISQRVENVETNVDNLTGEVVENSSAISSIQQSTDNISASIEVVDGKLNELTGELENLKQGIDVTINPENLEILIKKELENSGVGSSITTSTGYTFNEEGLTISKTGTELSTQITEDGMTVKRGEEDMLVANNEGVKATNLHATTYLIIGKYSRFEDYEPVRTGCFWIGN